MAVTRHAIVSAHAAIADRIYRTPVIDVDAASIGSSGRISFKLEYLQPPGSFKARGAAHNLVSRDIPPSGVIAASGGNHGVAVAWAARSLGVPANIFVPEISAPAKVQRLRDFGATVHQVGAVYAEAHEASLEMQRQLGALDVHPYDSETTVAGAGTLGKELDEQVGDIDTVVVATGGGGLASGVAAWFGDQVKLVIVEGELTPTWHEAERAGRPVPVQPSGVTADALGATQIGEVNFPILAAARTESVLVTDEQVIEARNHLWRSARIVLEHSAAVTIAALRSGRYSPADDERVAVVLCGANTDTSSLD